MTKVTKGDQSGSRSLFSDGTSFFCLGCMPGFVDRLYVIRPPPNRQGFLNLVRRQSVKGVSPFQIVPPSPLTASPAAAIENSKMFEQTKAMQLHYESILNSTQAPALPGTCPSGLVGTLDCKVVGRRGRGTDFSHSSSVSGSRNLHWDTAGAPLQRGVGRRVPACPHPRHCDDAGRGRPPHHHRPGSQSSSVRKPGNGGESRIFITIAHRRPIPSIDSFLYFVGILK